MGSRNTIIAALGFALTLFALPAFAVVTITFDQGIDGGEVSHTTGGAVTGSDIAFDLITVAGAGAADGTYTCLGCEMNFTSGMITEQGDSNAGNDWKWTGGTFSITGTVLDLPGMMDVGPTTLVSGDFSSVRGFNAGNRLQLSGFGFDEKNADMLEALGITSVQWAFANNAITTEAVFSDGGESFDGDVTEADFANVSVPIPATSLLMLLGLVGIAAARRK